jgi:hypothetical protein
MTYNRIHNDGKKEDWSRRDQLRTEVPLYTSSEFSTPFLKQVPDKPKPPKVTFELLKAWGLTSSNDRYIISILKKLDFLDQSGTPTQNYEAQTNGVTRRDVHGWLWLREPCYASTQNTATQPALDNAVIRSGDGDAIMNLLPFGTPRYDSAYD